jgi:spoIIIJ-associated protein
MRCSEKRVQFMSAERSIEMTGDSIEDAIARGLAQLGVGPAEVIVEVLDEPTKAMFGMEARPARVRLERLMVSGGVSSSSVVSSPLPAQPTTLISMPPARLEPAPDRERDDRPRRPQSSPQQGQGNREGERRGTGERRTGQRDDRRPRDGRDRDQRDARRPPQRLSREQDLLDSVQDEIYETLPVVDVGAEIPEREWEEEAQVAKVVLNELLERMDIRGRIAMRRAVADDQSGEAPYILDIMSEGNSAKLIGRKGETLAALQYITRLITSRELQRRADVIVDVNSYKARRAQALTNLANRMADDAISSGKTVIMEPMPPHERRIVHLALRARDDVKTQSIGEGAARKVTIVPNESASE